jgi:hypothetical protein
MIDGKNINAYAKKITTNQLFQATLVVLGVAFTISTISNNYYSIRWNRMRARMEEEKMRKENNN